MLKLRLKKVGRKRQPSYRVIVIPNTSRRDGKAIDEIGYYNPITKEIYFNAEKIIQCLKNGVQPTETVKRLLQKAKILNI
jgi:small subunit ribosomal protein S16